MSWEFAKCRKPDCFRKISPASAYCCGTCALADERGFELQPYSPDAHRYMTHSQWCEERVEARGEFTYAELLRLGWV